MSRNKRISVGYINPAAAGRNWSEYTVDHDSYRVTRDRGKGTRIELFVGKFKDAKQLFYVHPLQERYHYHTAYQSNIHEVLDRGKMAWCGVARVDCSQLADSRIIDLIRRAGGYNRVFDFRHLNKCDPATFARRVVEFYQALLSNPTYPSPYAGGSLEYWLPIRIHVPTGKEAYIEAVEREFNAKFHITNSDGGRGFMLESSIFLGEPPAAADSASTAGAGVTGPKPTSTKPLAKEVITIAKGPDLYKQEEIAVHTRDLTSAMMQLLTALRALASNRMKKHVRMVLDALCIALNMCQPRAVTLSRVGAAEAERPHIKWSGTESAAEVSTRLETMLKGLNAFPVEGLADVQAVLHGLVTIPGTPIEQGFYHTAPVHLAGLIEDLRREKVAETALAPARHDVAVPVAPPRREAADDFKPYEITFAPDLAVDVIADEDNVGELASQGGVAYTAIYYAEYKDEHGETQIHPIKISVVQGDMADYIKRPGVATVNLVNETGTDPQGGKFPLPFGIEKRIRQSALSGVAKATRDTLSVEDKAAITAIEQQAFKANGQSCYQQGDMMAFRLQQVGQADSLLLSEFPPKFHGKTFAGDDATFYQRTQFRLMEMARLRLFRKFASPVASTGNHGLNIKQGAKAMSDAYKAQIDAHPCAFDEIAIVVRADKDNSPQRVLAAADQVSDIFGVSLIPTKKGVPVIDPDGIIAGGAVYERPPAEVPRARACPPPTVAATTAVRMHKPVTKSLKVQVAEARKVEKAAAAREKAERDKWKGYNGGAGGGDCKLM